jgi:hypothetical protein
MLGPRKIRILGSTSLVQIAILTQSVPTPVVHGVEGLADLGRLNMTVA